MDQKFERELAEVNVAAVDTGCNHGIQYTFTDGHESQTADGRTTLVPASIVYTHSDGVNENSFSLPIYSDADGAGTRIAYTVREFLYVYCPEVPHPYARD